MRNFNLPNIFRRRKPSGGKGAGPFFSDPVFIFSLAVVTCAAFFYVSFFVAQLDTLSKFDDAYRYLRYSSNILSGNGIAWNPGERQIFGATNLLYLFFLTLARFLFQPQPEMLLRMGSFIFGGAGLILLIVACKYSLRKSGFKIIFTTGAWVFPLLLSQQVFLVHTKNGADTMLSFFCNTLLIFSVLALLKKPGAGRAVAVSLCAYLTYLARPDNAIIAVLFPFLGILLLQPYGRKRALTVFIISLAPLFIADTALKLLYFGDPFPLAFYANRTVFSAYPFFAKEWNAFIFFNSFLHTAYPFLLIIIFTAERRHIKLLAAFMAPVFITYLYYFRIIHIVGYHGRYYYPSLPYLVLCGAACLNDLLNKKDKRITFVAKSIAIRISIAVLLFYVNITIPRKGSRTLFTRYFPKRQKIERVAPKEKKDNVKGFQREWWIAIVRMSEIAKRLPEGTLVAATEHGYLSFVAPHVAIIDLTGLNNRYIAHNGFSMEYLLAESPDVIWMPHPAYGEILREIINSGEFQKEYDYYPGAVKYGLAIKKKSSHYGRITKAVEEGEK